MPSLFVIRGSDQGRRFELDGSFVPIGRDSSNVIQLHDTEVSRRHARLEPHQDGGYTVEDLGSSNGVFVNGRAVERQQLRSGDQVQLGRTLLLYTQPIENSQGDLREAVGITADPSSSERSRIVHSLTYAEGSRILSLADQRADAELARHAQSSLRVMYHTALAASQTMDIDQLLQRILELIFGWVEADRGCMLLVHPDTGELEPRARRTRCDDDDGSKMLISKTILDYVVSRAEGVLTSDAQQDDRFQPAASVIQSGVREAICVPMLGRYELVGAIYIDTWTAPKDALHTSGPTGRFSEDHLRLMVAIAHQAALAIEDSRYYSGMVQAERLAAIGQTVAMLSHHIKNILQGIRGGSYLIEMGLQDHDEDLVSKGWRIVDKNQAKISELVMDMLTFSKEREPERSVADLNQVVDDVVELMQGRAQDFDVKLTWSAGGKMPYMVFDPEGIHRAVTNVVTNAIDAACEVERDGLVTVATEYFAQTRRAQVIVTDNGPGIPEDERATLFSPFVSSKRGRGTGLGLSVSRKILGEHDGDIRIESSGEEGTKFVLDFPAILTEDIPEDQLTRGD